jgi:cation diffusion facilitator family transporter
MDERFKTVKNISIAGILANIFLLIIKLIAGFTSKSQAMIADGFNSAGDVFASVMTYTGNKIASKPVDKDHPYGHGKAEYIFSMIISLSLLIVAYTVLKDSYFSIINKNELMLTPFLVITAVVTIVLKTYLYIYSNKAGKKYNNLLIIANAEDHRNDIFITVLTLIGIGFSRLGIYWFDGVAGIIISIWIGYTGIKIFFSAYDVLMDKNIPESVKKCIEKVVLSIEGVDHLDSVSAKPTGINFIVIIKVSVPGNMTVLESHKIAAQIRERLRNIYIINDAIVHINPV